MREIKSKRHRQVIAAINGMAFICSIWSLIERAFICRSCATHTVIIVLLLLAVGSVMNDGISYREELLETKKSA